MSGRAAAILAGLALLGCSPLTPLEPAEFPPGVRVVSDQTFREARSDQEAIRRLVAGSTRVNPSFGGAAVYHYRPDGTFVLWHGLTDGGLERGSWYLQPASRTTIGTQVDVRICNEQPAGAPFGNPDGEPECEEVSDYDAGRTLTGDPFGLADGTPPFPMPGGLQSYITLLRAMAGCADPQRPCEAARRRTDALGG